MATIEPVERSASGHSGRLLLRMPQSLHAELARAADREGISLNQFITSALAAAVGWRIGEDAAPAKPKPAPADAESGRSQSRLLSIALAANFAVVAIAGAIAVALLVIAWQRGW